MWRRGEPSEWIRVEQSGIHGSGVFAAKDIPAGTPIVEYLGEIIDKDEAERRGLEQMEVARETGDAAVYVFIINDDYDIDGNFEWNVARLINHSCDPNCESAIDEDDRIWVSALRDIKKGEELGFDYGFDLDHYLDHPCYCGKDGCVGYIVGRDYWDELLKKEKARLEKAKKRKAKRARKGKKR
ncbi:SET domain-containing protein-lysine N-methyltransferase [Sulfuriroseicoccus oceanibius]|uniref:SET domain-containing protein-lysine N-methyltransferase n=2 Tax=Sulfuriroseicoccus oceanibius TaxID=2707525 RepID=A0A6B3L547_9BACT|nr:SET domain-containing protein-lysine N-methyltransferase [Sulfuriroseicoccus oceanibius]